MAIIIIVTLSIALAAIVATYTIRDAPPLRTKVRSNRALPNRSASLEAKMKSVLAGPGKKYGPIFTAYQIWETHSETRLDVQSTTEWVKLNEFTRNLIVRYLWRALESLTGCAVVIIDGPRLEWNATMDSDFRDLGFDWRTFEIAPQFAREG